jgi:hypothetical protein
MTVEETLERGLFSVSPLGVFGLSTGYKYHEKYPKWIASSWTPRQESGYGETVREALDDLLTNLGMV